PLHLDGRAGTRAQSAKRVAGILSRALDLPLTLWDERLSTRAVEQALIRADVSRARRRQGIDAESAVWMLQGFLDSLH
ncbi:MAG: Holliday junction resolvase RuvX, partial [Rhodospirillales bacterium]|nr:Holliday junction resolvase RuvX [Rhodospirillales bacterium]